MKFMLPKMHFEIEKWKFNKEYGVWVSNFGNFKDEHKRPIPIKIYEANGYISVKTKHGNRLAHRLVMYTWCPIEDREAFTVDHIDHNKRNIRVSNLEWVTREENVIRGNADLVKSVLPMINNAGTEGSDDLVNQWLKKYPLVSPIRKFIVENNITTKTIFVNNKGFKGTASNAMRWLTDNDPTFNKKVTCEYFFMQICKHAQKQDEYYRCIWNIKKEKIEDVLPIEG